MRKYWMILPNRRLQMLKIDALEKKQCTQRFKDDELQTSTSDCKKIGRLSQDRFQKSGRLIISKMLIRQR